MIDSGRIYTIWVQAIDEAGNRAVGSVNVTVPHSESDATTTTQPATTPTRRRAAGG